MWDIGRIYSHNLHFDFIVSIFERLSIFEMSDGDIRMGGNAAPKIDYTLSDMSYKDKHTVWKIRMCNFAQGRGHKKFLLEEFVPAEEPPNPTVQDLLDAPTDMDYHRIKTLREEHDKWEREKQKNQELAYKCKADLMSALSDSLILTLSSFTAVDKSAKELYDAINEHFAHRDLNSLASLKLKRDTARMISGESIVTFAGRLRSMDNAVAAIGQDSDKLSNKELVRLFFTALRDHEDTALSALAVGELFKLDEPEYANPAFEKIVTQVRSVAKEENIDESTERVLNMREGGGRGHGGRGRGGRGRGGRGRGRSGRGRGANDNGTPIDISDRICFFCGGKGHFKRDCPGYARKLEKNKTMTEKRKSEKNKDTPTPKDKQIRINVVKCQEESAARVLIARTTQETAIIDSGAEVIVFKAARPGITNIRETKKKIIYGNNHQSELTEVGSWGAIDEVAICRGISDNVVSTSKLADVGHVTILTQESAYILRPGAELEIKAKDIVLRAPRSGGLYIGNLVELEAALGVGEDSA